MQTLGLSDTTDRSESRLKSLFWPSIQSGADVDYLSAQGYWVCTLVGATSLVFVFLSGQPVFATALLLFYHFGGVGVRERDFLAAVAVFALCAMDTLLTVIFLLFTSPWGVIVFRVFVAALLFSNLRATWLASSWRADSEEAALPPRFSATWSDRFVDQWPALAWPKVRIIYYIFALGLLSLITIGFARMAMRSMF
jgi:hypothetical protein